MVWLAIVVVLGSHLVSAEGGPPTTPDAVGQTRVTTLSPAGRESLAIGQISGSDETSEMLNAPHQGGPTARLLGALVYAAVLVRGPGGTSPLSGPPR